MNLEATHDLLVLGPDYATCRRHVERFFSVTPLVRYDAIEVVENLSLPATDPLFWARMDEGVAGNRRALKELIGELKGYGFEKLVDLLKMEQGFQSKIIHTAAHLLDGFFGIDSCFYSLAHDSHRLSKEQCLEIKESPADYRLLHVKGRLTVKSGGKPAFLRSFEK